MVFAAKLAAAALAAAPFLAQASPVEAGALENRQEKCVVNRLETDSWSAGVLSRRRVEFSASGTDVEAYCDYWPCPGEDLHMFNTQCYYHGELGSWVVDVSVNKGALGGAVFNECMVLSLDRWRTDTGCNTAGTKK